MKIRTGGRTTPRGTHFATARRWPLALLCGLLLLTGSAFAQNDSTRRAPAPAASETQKAPDPNETATLLPQSSPTGSASDVESPDMMNIYNGVVELDARGRATVTLPAGFKALNREYRYQLTPVGAPGPNLHVASEIDGNTFRIAGGRRGMKVSWQVTGVRKDAYAEAHHIPVEEKKLVEKGVNHAQRSAAERTPTNRQSDPRNWQ